MAWTLSDALLCAQELYPGSTILSATLAPEWDKAP